VKIKAKYKKGSVTVKMIVKHPMESGEIAGKTKKSHYITNLQASANGKVVYDADLSSGVSKNPYLKFSFKGAKKGDTLEVKWVDNQGKSEMAKAKIK
jgi:sulfur-oxidizing protein SoxZ